MSDDEKQHDPVSEDSNAGVRTVGVLILMLLNLSVMMVVLIVFVNEPAGAVGGSGAPILASLAIPVILLLMLVELIWGVLLKRASHDVHGLLLLVMAGVNVLIGMPVLLAVMAGG